MIYLIHFDRPYKHARHYLGSTDNLDARMAAHRDGNGARLMAVITDAGIPWRLSRTWPGGRTRERQIKNMGGRARRCPDCGVRVRDRWAGGRPTPRTGDYRDVWRPIVAALVDGQGRAIQHLTAEARRVS